jgi:hypothetical protein
MASPNRPASLALGFEVGGCILVGQPLAPCKTDLSYTKLPTSQF